MPICGSFHNTSWHKFDDVESGATDAGQARGTRCPKVFSLIVCSSETFFCQIRVNAIYRRLILPNGMVPISLFNYKTKQKRFMLKEKKTQSKCMFRLGDDDIESPYKKFLDTFDFFV